MARYQMDAPKALNRREARSNNPGNHGDYGNFGNSSLLPRHFQIVGHRKHAGHGVRAHVHQIFVSCAVHNALQSDVSTIHNDVNRTVRTDSITMQWAVAVDRAES